MVGYWFVHKLLSFNFPSTNDFWVHSNDDVDNNIRLSTITITNFLSPAV